MSLIKKADDDLTSIKNDQMNSFTTNADDIYACEIEENHHRNNNEDENENSVHEETSLEEDGNNNNNDEIESSSRPPAKKQQQQQQQQQQQPWREIFILSFSSLGAIYGDLGTSPLYVLNSIKYPQSPPNKTDIYGSVSIIFYLFTFIVIFKYICIVLILGPNNGEGGQVAIYAKLARHLNIGPKGVTIPGGPKEEMSDLQILTKQNTAMSSSSSIINTVSSRIELIKYHPMMIKFIQWFILFACFLGCSLVMSDGLLTPTTSVLSSIGGIEVAVPSFTDVLAVSEVILILLFIIQQFGSSKISFLFAPIIFIWLLGLIICGIYNIVKYHPEIFAALSPYYAIALLRNGGIDVFSGAMLAITGTEAMFADVGHFGKLPIQLTLGGFVYPALILCYLGQGAYLVKHPEAITNPFFLSIPGGTNSATYWVMFVLATLATIIASQALILSVFSIISQLINLECFPKLKIVHVSSHYSGKVYIPTMNWILMIGVICTTAGFQNSNNVTAAYGLGISLDFIVTSFLIIICMLYVYNANVIWPILFCLVFVPLELCFVISNMKKVPHGAWFPLVMAGLFFFFLAVWRWARSKKVNEEYDRRVRIGELFPFYAANSTTIMDLTTITPQVRNSQLTTQYNQDDVNSKFGVFLLQKHHGIGFMYINFSVLAGSPNTLPRLYEKLVTSFVSIPSNFMFVCIKVVSIPYVENNEDRILVAPMRLSGHYKCIIRFGFMEDIRITHDLRYAVMRHIPQLALMSNDQLSAIPNLHFFENGLIQCHGFEQCTNSSSQWKIIHLVRKVIWLIRMLVINHFFSPIFLMTQEYGSFLECDDEKQESDNKVFLGGITRI
ncbi:hypothetical protein KGF56_002873 [Candida oxycetoniae]|uniref:High affinity potassium transporter n=1 Tax=Candida oxycetoniae TaxID=497107 RepID=A0AAI9SWE3_9ASCO|nr:uncharacterized protein KGF56_002873 [Candida oxycetoniae]KAI3404353.2 hypothetical protein KGF56_002873 [Candida oxycetoniae]